MARAHASPRIQVRSALAAPSAAQLRHAGPNSPCTGEPSRTADVARVRPVPVRHAGRNNVASGLLFTRARARRFRFGTLRKAPRLDVQIWDAQQRAVVYCQTAPLGKTRELG